MELSHLKKQQLRDIFHDLEGKKLLDFLFKYSNPAFAKDDAIQIYISTGKSKMLYKLLFLCDLKLSVGYDQEKIDKRNEIRNKQVGRI